MRKLQRGWRPLGAVLLLAALSPFTASALLFGQSEVDGTATAVVPPTNWSDSHFAIE